MELRIFFSQREELHPGSTFHGPRGVFLSVGSTSSFHGSKPSGFEEPELLVHSQTASTSNSDSLILGSLCVPEMARQIF